MSIQLLPPAEPSTPFLKDLELPSLSTFNSDYLCAPATSSLKCMDYIGSIEGLLHKEVKFAGFGRQALLNCFAYILLAIGCKQIKYYPHLITLIKEQFFKPGVFAEFDKDHRNRILNVCRNIEIELISSGSVAEFCEINEEFVFGFQYVLEKILKTSEADPSTDAVIDTLRRRFNIDSTKLEVGGSEAGCWVLGMQRKIYLFD